ncbi:MAG: mannan endo-1,4-beta-mannosidase A-1 [Bogoriella megaspora]|nr:MAG: mannan endo-1,4-beta-mannosidase A-1 [Bogoriella megaspora]
MKLEITSAFAFAGLAWGQQSAWGQCGGTGWTGATTCVAGYTCSVSNAYYSQCIPGTASSSAPSTTLKTTTTPVSSPTNAPAPAGSFAKTNGLMFNIDGTTKYYVGTNSYWIGFLTNNADVDTVMSHLQTTGVKILRVWGFNDVNTNPGANGQVYYQSLVPGQAASINTGANGLQRLDYVVKSAEAHGIKLIINFVNNWTDYGGMAAYAKWQGLTDQNQFYTNTAIQTQYKAYIKAVVSRYSTSTAVFAWELANEPRYSGTASNVIFNWATTISAYIKSLDRNHMVTLGDEGFDPSAGDGSYPYSLSAGGYSFSQNLGIPNLDFGTFHMYPESWGVDANAWPIGWIKAHGDACVAAKKPCLLEEYGYRADINTMAPWQQAALQDAGIAADAYWQYGDTLSSGQTSQDGNTIYYGSSAYTTFVTNHVAAANKVTKS